MAFSAMYQSPPRRLELERRRPAPRRHETEVQRIRIVIEGLASHVPTALIALDQGWLLDAGREDELDDLVAGPTMGVPG